MAILYPVGEGEVEAFDIWRENGGTGTEANIEKLNLRISCNADGSWIIGLVLAVAN